VIEVGFELRWHAEVVHGQADDDDISLLQLRDQGVRVRNHGRLLGISRLRLGDKRTETLGIEMRHRLGRSDMAHYDLRVRMLLLKGLYKLIGQLARLTFLIVDTGIDLQQGSHEISPKNMDHLRHI
jgi:hypothetical protein